MRPGAAGERLSLDRRICEVEARLTDRRRAVGGNAVALESGVREAMSSPLALLAAVGVGVAIEQYRRRRRVAPQFESESASEPVVLRPSIFATLMEGLSLASTLVAILPALRHGLAGDANAAEDPR